MKVISDPQLSNPKLAGTDTPTAAAISTNGPPIVAGQRGNATASKGARLKNPAHPLLLPTADNRETALDDEAIRWAGLVVAMEVINA